MRYRSMPSRAASRFTLLLWASTAMFLAYASVTSEHTYAMYPLLLILTGSLVGARRHLLNARRPRLAAHEPGD